MNPQRQRFERDPFDSIDHLGPEAVVAYVDGEMTPIAAERARMHIALCAECRDEVYRQSGTSQALRQACMTSSMRAPSELIVRLTAIAQEYGNMPQASTSEGLADALVQRIDDALRVVRGRKPRF